MPDDASLKQGFVKGVIACTALLLLVAAVIQLLNDGHSRPEGAAERWLAAVSDSGREGIREDALERARKIGPPGLALPLVPQPHDDRDRLFSDLEVGRATAQDEEVRRVPFRLHQHVESGKAPVKDGVVLLREEGDEWRVTGLAPRRPGERVPSEGGQPPSSAPIGVWVAALLIGLAITATCSLLVRWAERSDVAAPAAAT